MTKTFDQLGLPDAITSTLNKQDIHEPFPIQEATIADALAGRDVAGRAPTGSGKTLAFGLPILANVGTASPHKPRALILAPTRELAAQIRRDLAPYGKATRRQVFAIYGGVRYESQKDMLRKGVDVLVATPGRLEDLIEQRSVDLSEVTIVAIDEADRMADMGFLPDVRRILNQTAKQRQTLLFSATLDGDVAVLIREYQTDPVRHEAEAIEPETTDAEHHFWLVQNEDKVQHTADVVGVADRSIVFTRTRHGADRLAKQLSKLGVGAVAMHGGRSQNQRNRALQSFSSGNAQALIATDVAARGIHIDAVASVVHFDPPNDHKDYVHRSGRTARAGASGNIVSLVTGNQRRAVRKMQDKLDLHHPIEKPRLAAILPDGDTYTPDTKRDHSHREPSRGDSTHGSRNDKPKKKQASAERHQTPKPNTTQSSKAKTKTERPERRQRRTPKATRQGDQTVHVSNLPWGATDEDVEVMFSRYGDVQQAVVMIDNRGRSKGYALVDMPKSAASRAMHALDGSPLDGRTIKVRFSRT
ncbi:MAG: DEAD/DEAH box helicase [Actinomycetia bacterium]|nr:DEAD/DEAH box helicase [Actinomycetes bacterium]